ncbi:TRAP transporter substrate-binding protein [Domibacillus sp. DTU_2020_1001157_1_SI_ALB_TIR_016]|uniref:TRAP transporter substrate-binding protein n=1 Tax=Domibacillus sp. DTU_2020_1001157_1_SI_ALB_TIR_016 TaxID=3077789 RepID=UPI0028E1DF7E|nr:TRAP transporter substrate-binding protein [Domibacillus sp. DTU_2020_1001157_1_SI_ALB_TIR_016]WNS79595.1 TRAP transporter substrate-binding protein [Domibacillus sp. DTU_2020_1001157_1_SI_ALB_TIR_016]
MKKPMVKVLALPLSVFVLLGGCSSGSENAGNTSNGSNSSGKPVTLKITNFYADDHVVNKAIIEKFIPVVEENSNGTIQVDHFPNSTLGGEEAMYDGTRNGTIEMAVLSQIMEPDVPKIGIFSMPFLFKDYANAKAVLDSEIGEDIKTEFEVNTGLKHLGYGINGFRVFSSNRPVEKIGDFEGLKLRMPNVPMMIALGQSLGANISPMPLPEIFPALEQKVIDGQDNPYAALRSNAWYEVQTNVLESRHLFLPNNYVASNKFWSSLNPEQQKVVAEAVQATVEREWELTESGEAEDKKFLKEKGLTITVPDEKFMNDMIEATEGVYTEFYKENPWAEEIVNEIKAQQK